MAERYVALLRGINVGRAKRVAMPDLRGLVEGLGFTDVRTVLNSGNVVFTGDGDLGTGDTGSAIQSALEERLGVRARVTVVAARVLSRALGADPLASVATDPTRLLIAVPSTPAVLDRLAALARTEWSPEAIAIGEGVAYLWCPGGIAHSALAAAVERALGDAVTSRNKATVLKIVAAAGETDPSSAAADRPSASHGPQSTSRAPKG